MSESFLSNLKLYFSELPDPRAQHSIEHLLIDIVMLTICAVICGAESWVEIENYGLAKQEWLATFLELPNGIPSHDTLLRVFARLRPEALQQCFLNWVQAEYEISGGKLLAVDGKTLRGSYERGGKQGIGFAPDSLERRKLKNELELRDFRSQAAKQEQRREQPKLIEGEWLDPVV